MLFCIFSQEVHFQIERRVEKTEHQITVFSGWAERLLLCGGYRRKLFWWISAGALISDTLRAAISFGESLFPNIHTAWLRDDNAMEIPLSCLDTLSAPLQMHSVCFPKWSKIFWLCLNTRADHSGQRWAGCQQEARRPSAPCRPCLRYVPSAGWARPALLHALSCVTRIILGQKHKNLTKKLLLPTSLDDISVLFLLENGLLRWRSTGQVNQRQVKEVTKEGCMTGRGTCGCAFASKIRLGWAPAMCMPRVETAFGVEKHSSLVPLGRLTSLILTILKEWSCHH